MNVEQEKPRWQYRLDNFGRAFILLREGVEQLSDGGLSQLEKEGLIQRFEYTWELAWKTISDFLAYEGVEVTPVTPRNVLREAFERGVIDSGPEWMAALDARNRMSHTYDFKVFEKIIGDVASRYLALFDDLYETMTARVLQP